MIEQDGLIRELVNDTAGKLDRQIIGLPARQIDQNIFNFVRLSNQIDAGNKIGPVLAARESSGFSV